MRGQGVGADTLGVVGTQRAHTRGRGRGSDNRNRLPPYCLNSRFALPVPVPVPGGMGLKGKVTAYSVNRAFICSCMSYPPPFIIGSINTGKPLPGGGITHNLKGLQTNPHFKRVCGL